MIIENNPFDYVGEKKNGVYTLRKATPTERAKMIEEYKDKREKELLKELRELETIH